jgi:hypothetical protein
VIPDTMAKSPSCGIDQHKCSNPAMTSEGLFTACFLIFGSCFLLAWISRGGRKTESEFTAKAARCNSMGHPLVQRTCANMGSNYNHSWICDNCNREFMRSHQPSFLHCCECKTDFCNECKPVPDIAGLSIIMSIEPDSVRACLINLAGSIQWEQHFNLESTVLDLEAAVREKVRTAWIHVCFLSDCGTEVRKTDPLRYHARLGLKGDVRGNMLRSLPNWL